jgi:hypothetical protein
MATKQSPENHGQSPEYYRYVDTAAPDLERAEFLNHPEYGWLPVIAATADIESGRVTAVLGRRSEDQSLDTFPLCYQSHYSNTEDLILTEQTMKSITAQITPENHTIEPANIIVKTNGLETTPTDY